MKKFRIIAGLAVVFLFTFGNIGFGASVFIVPKGGDLIDKNVELPILSLGTYTFDVYFLVTDTDTTVGIYNVGVDINYNPSFFSLADNPKIDNNVWTVPASKIVWPGDDNGDYITGNDFGYYVSDDNLSGLKGLLHIGSFNLEATGLPPLGTWIITTGDFSPSDDTIDLSFKVFDADIAFRGVSTPVPIPSTLLLLGGGLVGVFGFRRKRGKRSS